MITRGPHPAALSDVSEPERGLFRELYCAGSWPHDQAVHSFGEQRFQSLMAGRYLIPVQTEIGRLTLLLARGRVAAFGVCDKPEAFSVQIDRAYKRIALHHLKWPVMSDQSLCQHDRTGQMIAAYTSYGPSLVYAALGSGRGISLEAMNRLVKRHNSSALYHGYEVVIITPSGRRGQKLGAKHPSWLHVVHCLPKVGEGGRLSIQGSVEGQRRGSIHLPDRDQRVQAALSDLAVDTVLSRRQLERHYGLYPTDLPGVPFVETLVRPVHSRYGLEVPNRIYVADKRMAYLHDHVLTHRAGVAEMRRQLGVPADSDQWEVEAKGRLDYEEPDAVWRSPYGDVAVEYDVGTYTMRVVDKKVGTFKDRDFRGVVWGAASPQRAARLTRVLEPQGVQVLTTQWWLEKDIETALHSGISA